MNERIRELAEQANNAIGGNAFSMARYNEKFAELIVRECARLARNTNLEDVEGGDSAVLRAAGEQIEKHFGVEE
jgi:hypothetical protein